MVFPSRCNQQYTEYEYEALSRSQKSPDLNLYTPGITVGTRLVSRLVLVQARSTLQPTEPKYFAANIPVPDTTGQARGSLRMSKLVRAQSATALICV